MYWIQVTVAVGVNVGVGVGVGVVHDGQAPPDVIVALPLNTVGRVVEHLWVVVFEKSVTLFWSELPQQPLNKTVAPPNPALIV